MKSTVVKMIVGLLVLNMMVAIGIVVILKVASEEQLESLKEKIMPFIQNGSEAFPGR